MRALPSPKIAPKASDPARDSRTRAGRTRIHWRDTPLIRMQDASEILGLSVASLYRLARDGKLVLKKLEGRTLVDTKSLIEVADNASDWTPSTRPAAALSKRAARARESWEGV